MTVDRIPGIAAVAPGQAALEAAKEVVERPGDDDNVVGVAESNHDHGGKADALEDGNAIPDGYAA